MAKSWLTVPSALTATGHTLKDFFAEFVGFSFRPS